MYLRSVSFVFFFVSCLKFCLLRIPKLDLGRSLSAARVVVGHVVGDMWRSVGSEDSSGKEMMAYEHQYTAIEMNLEGNLHLTTVVHRRSNPNTRNLRSSPALRLELGLNHEVLGRPVVIRGANPEQLCDRGLDVVCRLHFQKQHRNFRVIVDRIH